MDLSKVNNGELRILVWVAKHCDPHNVVRCTYAQIAGGVGFTRRYTIKCVKQLREKDQIEVRALPGRYIAIWLKVGFGHGPIDEPIPPPPDWYSQPMFPL